MPGTTASRPRKSSRTSATACQDIPGLEVQIAAQENGPPAGKAINLRVESTIYDDLAPVVAKLRDYVENDLGDTIDVEDGRPSPGIDWQVTIDRVAAAKYGIGVRELSPYVQLVTSGVKIGTYRPGRRDRRTRHPRSPAARMSARFDALDSLRIVTAQGLVPVCNFIKREAGAQGGQHQPQERRLLDDASRPTSMPGVAADDKIELVKAWERTRSQGYPVDTQDRLWRRRRADRRHHRLHRQRRSWRRWSLIALILLLEYNSF